MGGLIDKESGTKHDPTRSAPDYRNRDNNRIYEMNSLGMVLFRNSAVSLEIDFSHADRADGVSLAMSVAIITGSAGLVGYRGCRLSCDLGNGCRGNR